VPWRRRLPRRGNLTTELDIKTHADERGRSPSTTAIERTCIGFVRCRGVGELILNFPHRRTPEVGVNGWRWLVPGTGRSERQHHPVDSRGHKAEPMDPDDPGPKINTELAHPARRTTTGSAVRTTSPPTAPLETRSRPPIRTSAPRRSRTGGSWAGLCASEPPRPGFGSSSISAPGYPPVSGRTKSRVVVATLAARRVAKRDPAPIWAQAGGLIFGAPRA
jgi:hypothetical protein